MASFISVRNNFPLGGSWSIRKYQLGDDTEHLYLERDETAAATTEGGETDDNGRAPAVTHITGGVIPKPHGPEKPQETTSGVSGAQKNHGKALVPRSATAGVSPKSFEPEKPQKPTPDIRGGSRQSRSLFLGGFGNTAESSEPVNGPQSPEESVERRIVRWVDGAIEGDWFPPPASTRGVNQPQWRPARNVDPSFEGRVQEGWLDAKKDVAGQWYFRTRGKDSDKERAAKQMGNAEYFVPDTPQPTACDIYNYLQYLRLDRGQPHPSVGIDIVWRADNDAENQPPPETTGDIDDSGRNSVRLSTPELGAHVLDLAAQASPDDGNKRKVVANQGEVGSSPTNDTPLPSDLQSGNGTADRSPVLDQSGEPEKPSRVAQQSSKDVSSHSEKAGTVPASIYETNHSPQHVMGPPPPPPLPRSSTTALRSAPKISPQRRSAGLSGPMNTVEASNLSKASNADPRRLSSLSNIISPVNDPTEGFSIGNTQPPSLRSSSMMETARFRSLDGIRVPPIPSGYSPPEVTRGKRPGSCGNLGPSRKRPRHLTPEQSAATANLRAAIKDGWVGVDVQRGAPTVYADETEVEVEDDDEEEYE